MVKKELLLIRHGETEWNRLALIQGHLDSPLTVEGMKQVEMFAQRLCSWGIEKIYSSDLPRALSTAEVIGSVCGREVESTPLLRERCFGLVQGLDWKEIEVRHPQIHAGLRGDDLDFVPPGGESRASFHARVVHAVLGIFRAHEYGTIVAVTHGGVISAFIRHVLGLPVNAARRYSLRNLAINRFVEKRGALFLETLGDVGHSR